MGLRLGDTCEPGMLALGTVVGRVRRRVGHLVLGGALDQGYRLKFKHLRF